MAEAVCALALGARLAKAHVSATRSNNICRGHDLARALLTVRRSPVGSGRNRQLATLNHLEHTERLATQLSVSIVRNWEFERQIAGVRRAKELRLAWAVQSAL